ncbi:MAG TPA: tetratricopeptide repeat protein, partial [Caldimonas sp.]
MLPRPSHSVALLAVCLLSACSMWRRGGTPDNEPTLKTLASRQVVVEKDTTVAVNEAKAIDAYRKFLDIAPQAPQRSEAMRRIGDLEMDSADSQSATSAAVDVPDYKAAIVRYQDYLKTYPADPNNDRVLYQMARAYEQGGDLDTALKTLDRLVKDYPATRYGNEAQFRRGELLFTARNYAGAEKAYATVLAAGESSPFQ